MKRLSVIILTIFIALCIQIPVFAGDQVCNNHSNEYNEQHQTQVGNEDAGGVALEQKTQEREAW